MGFSVLGPLTVTHNGRDITPTAPKVRQVLAFLLLARNQTIQASDFIDELWQNNPPDSAMTTLQTYIYKLRKDLFEPTGIAQLNTGHSGYVLHIPEESIDVSTFEKTTARGKAALDQEKPEEAAKLLTEALSLWRGKALLGVTTGELISAHVTRLEETRIRALEMRIEADLTLGRHSEIISELKQLTFTYPLHEPFHLHLMTALRHSGRRYEALEVYRRLRSFLVEELGLEPSLPLQQIHQELLVNHNPEPPDQGGAPPVQATARIAPAQLPPDTPDFVGRTASLHELSHHLRHHPDTAAPVITITGMTGVGKTALALHTAHLHRAEYPDGQLFADLKGANPGTSVPVREVLADFLRAIDVPATQIPESLEERAKMFRTHTWDKRILILLDNASDITQIAPLLPATPDCAVLITNRWNLHTVTNTHVHELEPFTPEESIAFLGRVIGQQQTDEERGHAVAVAERCGHLPLALRCVAARLSGMRSWTLARIAELLDGDDSVLNQLQHPQYNVRASIDKSYARLPPHEQSTLRLLSLLPTRQFSTATAAELVGNSPELVEIQLNRLVNHNLLRISPSCVGKEPHYTLHQLVRNYAQDQLRREYGRTLIRHPG